MSETLESFMNMNSNSLFNAHDMMMIIGKFLSESRFKKIVSNEMKLKKASMIFFLSPPSLINFSSYRANISLNRMHPRNYGI